MKWLVMLFVAMTLGQCARAQEIAFTWDDLPEHSELPPNTTWLQIGDRIIAAMKAEHMPPAYGFMNGIRTVEDPETMAVLTHWHAAGLPLGNHTWSHMNLDENKVEKWEADVARNEPLLKRKAGNSDWHWLRYPYLAEGNTPEKVAAARAYLAAHGYRVAGVTMSFSDWDYNAPYARCVVKHDAANIAKLKKMYMDAAEQAITYSRTLSQAAYGHDIPYVLLMHTGGLDAVMLPKLLAMYKSHGFRFITLEQAQAAPEYKNYMDMSGPLSMPNMELLAKAKGLPVPPRMVTPDLSNVCPGVKF